MNNTNPFLIIGMRPNAISGLSDAEALEVAIEFTRAQQKKFHPDVTPKKMHHRRSTNINAAVEVLKRCSREKFAQLRAQFVSTTPLKRKLEKSENALQESQEKFVQMGARMAELFSQQLDMAVEHDEMAAICIHNPWLSNGQSYYAMSKYVDSHLFFCNVIIDQAWNIVSYDDDTVPVGKKAIIGSIDTKMYLNDELAFKIKEYYKKRSDEGEKSDMERRQSIAYQKILRTGKTIYRGPRIMPHDLHLIAKDIRLGVYDNGYIVTANRAHDGSIFFQIEGCVKTCASLLVEKEVLEA